MRATIAFALCVAGFAAAAEHGAILGHVVESKTGEPVKKAVVILRRGQEPGTGAAADASGAFRFDDLDTGPYTVSVERTGFILDPESQRTVAVKPGPDETEITLKLIRTGAISGRVLDSDGEPVTGAGVQIAPVNQKKGGTPSAGAMTDDRGAYRAFNIAPGKYRILVSYESRLKQRQVKMQRPRTPPGAAPEDSYAVTYFPAALNPKQARTVDVEPGADLQGYDIQLQRARGVNVQGTVRGGGAIVMVTLSSVRQTIGFRSYDTVVQDPGGGFELTQVQPGTYELAAIAPLAEKQLSANRVIEVGDADIDGIQLTLAPPQTVSGTILLPEGRKMPPGLIAVLTSRESRLGRGGGVSQPGSDGSFRMNDVAPGDYDLVLANAGPGDDLYVSAIRAGDDDALAGGVHVGGSETGPLKVVVKGNGGIVRISVKDAHGKALPDAWVKLVPDPPRRTQMALYGDAKTDASGTCVLLGVAPGSYRAFAFPEERQVDFRDAAATADMEDSGAAFQIAEGESKGLELTPVPEDN